MTLKNLSTNKNLFTVFLFFVFISCYLAIKTTDNAVALEKLKMQINSKGSTYKSNSQIESISQNPLSMTDLINKLVQISQEPESEKQTKTFIEMSEKVRKLVEDMLVEQKDSYVIFRNNFAILTKYYSTSKSKISIYHDKYDLTMALVEFYQNIKNSKGKIDLHSSFQSLITNLSNLNDLIKEFKNERSEMDNLTKEYYDKLEELVKKLNEAYDSYDPLDLDIFYLRTQTITDDYIPQITLAIRNKIFERVNVKYEKKIVKRYIEVFEAASDKSPGAVSENLFMNVDIELENAKKEANSYSVKLEDARKMNISAANSLRSSFEEFEKNTQQRYEIVKTLLTIIDYMNLTIKKVSVKFMVYLEEVKDKFKDYNNSYEVTKIKEYIYKNILFNEEGKKLVEENHKSKEVSKF